ncbi:putative Pentatricopeptide repeat-containing protein [Zostera marina]|uniref:Putative Pentatricopeptide repeat-containing protein n=1 Tax=Zostera marina TaxID=29655 RepID=A0A0K9Q336_ZOSMR|nr:putative Pentatricopeptide repeat-containing protein [Zostera marina]
MKMAFSLIGSRFSSSRRFPPRFLSVTAGTEVSSETSSFKITPLVKSILREKDNDVLVARFNEISSTSVHFRCKGEVYLTIIRRLAEADRKDAISKILEAQKLTPGMTNEGFAIRIISLYGKAKMADEAESTFHQLPSLNCPLTVRSFNNLLSAFNDAGEYQRTIDAFKSIPLTKDLESIVPDMYSYTIMMHAMCLMGDMEAAEEYLSIMENKEMKPNVATYCTIMNGYYRKGRIEDGEKIWKMMKVKKCRPDFKCYNVKIRALCSLNKVSEAEKLLKVMKNNGIEPTAYSYTCLVINHCKAGSLADAKKVFEEMQKRECDLNRGTYEALIPKLCEAGELDLALKLCNGSIQKRCFINPETVQAVADKLAEQDDKVWLARRLVNFAWSSPRFSMTNLKMPPTCLSV